MPHICSDEIMLFLAAFPIIGVFFSKLHKYYHNHFHHKCHEEGCQEHHLEHTHSTIEDPPGLTKLSIEEVDQRFGTIATILLMFDRNLLGARKFQTREDFVWFVNLDNQLMARCNNKYYSFSNNVWTANFVEEPKPLEEAIRILRMFLISHEVYRNMLGCDKSEDVLQAEKFLEGIVLDA